MALRRHQNFARYALSIQYHGSPFIGFTFQKELDVDIPRNDIAGNFAPQFRSVEFWLKKAVESLLGVDRDEETQNDLPYENLQVSSRTDRGVHALHNTLHIDMKPPKISTSSGLWKPSALVKGLNFHLKHRKTAIMGSKGTPVSVSNCLRILNAQLAPDCMHNPFHDETVSSSTPTVDWNARFSATERTYMYRILMCPVAVVGDDGGCDTTTLPPMFASSESWAIPFEHDRSWILNSDLDVSQMRTAASHLLGTHDFSSFRKAGCKRKSPVVTIHDIEIYKQPWSIGGPLSMCQFERSTESQTLLHGNYCQLVTVVVRGNAFLYRQVRNLVALLVSVGEGKTKANVIPELLEARDRTKLPCRTAPASGLYLARVRHGDFVV